MPPWHVPLPTQTARAAAAVTQDAPRVEPLGIFFLLISYFLFLILYLCLFNDRLREQMGKTSKTTVSRCILGACLHPLPSTTRTTGKESAGEGDNDAGAGVQDADTSRALVFFILFIFILLMNFTYYRLCIRPLQPEQQAQDDEQPPLPSRLPFHSQRARTQTYSKSIFFFESN